jgi:galactonate dehydratase
MSQRFALFPQPSKLRENLAGLGEVTAKSPVPIATGGEGLFSRFEFKQLLDVKGAAIIQPDVMHAGE